MDGNTSRMRQLAQPDFKDPSKPTLDQSGKERQSVRLEVRKFNIDCSVGLLHPYL